jgi:hypothetical protein
LIVPLRWDVEPAWLGQDSRSRAHGLAMVRLRSWAHDRRSVRLFGIYRLSRRLARNRDADAGIGFYSLLTPLAIIVITELYLPVLSTVLRISGTPRVVTEFSRIICFFGSAAWLVLMVPGFSVVR